VPKLGLALSGGGVPGVAAHIGFLRALEQNGINLNDCVIVGASAGGLVASALAFGLSLTDIAHAWTKFARNPFSLLPDEVWHAMHLLSPSPEPGFLDLEGVLFNVYDALKFNLFWSPITTTEDWRDGVGVVASDLTANRVVLLHKGGEYKLRTPEAMVATAAFPGLFSGVRAPDGHLLVDGGLFCDVPADQCRALGAEKVAAVIVGEPLQVPATLTVFDVVRFSLAAMVDRGKFTADVEVHVPVRGGLLDLRDFEEDMSVGFEVGGYHAARIVALASGSAA
jgi:NTE family protein